MFGEQFYPTPKETIRLLLSPIVNKKPEDINITDRIFLEPSAGKGDILDYIKVNLFSNRSSHFKAYCVEIDPNLIHILHGKGYQVIGNNFLDLKPTNYFNTIVMNPPFAFGAEHVLKAWEILENGEIHAILNQETIDNPFSATRKALKAIISSHGSVEYIGRAFTNAEVKTDVSCVIVRIYKKDKKRSLLWEPKDFKASGVVDFNDQDLLENKVALNDRVENMIIQAELFRTAMIKLIRSFQAASFYSKGIWGDEMKKLSMWIGEFMLSEATPEAQYNLFNDMLRKSIWHSMLSVSRISDYLTSNVQKNWHQFIETTGQMEVSKENVYTIIDMIFANRHEIMKKAIVDVFDLMTSYSKENKMIIEHWKTNSCWKVNRKVIIPYVVRYGEYMQQSSLKSHGGRFKIDYAKSREFWDIDKVMKYLSGKSECIDIEGALKTRFLEIGNIRTGDHFNNELESTFFKIKFWKKGTVHLYFKDEKLWDRLNMIACDQKNWLPPEEKKEWKEREKYESPNPDNFKLLL